MRFHLQRSIVVLLIALTMAAATAQHSTARSSSMSAHRLVQAFACIHHYEGAWNDRNAPYWGGLQMDMAFQRTYGREFLRLFGTADHWTPGMQIAVAIKAYATRGFGPWPNTARRCGLS